ncbi:MAG: PKD domain-containing protein, partial [Vicinamibacterales bacterium]
MRNHVEHGSRSGSAALGACFKIHALITAAILIVGVFGASEIAWAQGQPIIFSAVGDVPYSDNEKPEFQQHMDNHDLYSPAEFLVHLGDIMPQSTCDESWYSWMRAALRSLSVPAFIVPGDNEWSDCNNPPPSQAWTYWVTHLLAVEQGMCGLPLIERQAVRTENFAFVKKGVLFIGINMVSGGLGSSEEETRGQQDADWVRYQFQTKGSTVRAAVIFAQASPRDPFETQFRSDAVAFAKPVLYIHGDGHSWVYNHPYLESNITRVMVERGDANNPPVQVTVTMDPVNPFLFNQNPWPTGTPPLNRAPCADAGPDLEGTLANGVVLQGRVSDDGEPIPANLTFGWSQVSGPGIVSFTNADALTTQAHFSTAGIYQLRLTASDGALVGNDTVSVNVQVVLNAAPVLDIIGPDTGSSFDESDTVTFMGWAYDIEDGDLTDSLTWTSNRDGLIGVGGQLSTSGLSIGVHSITASITDAGGKTSSQVIGLTIVGAPTGPTTVEVRVNTSADDGEESTSGSISLNSSDLELVLDSTNQTVGMRFPVVAVPRYAVIGNAWIQFEADRTGSVATSLTVQGQAADSASAFTTATANLSSRPKTTAAVAWSPVPWNSAGAAGPEQRTPNLSSVMQEIVNRPGWSSGNSLAIFITGTGQRAAQSYDGSSAGAPLLHVEFVPGQAPPVVNAGQDRAVNLPNVVLLDATVTDDGLPNPPGSVTTTWSQLSGTGTATFGNPHAIDTTVSFSG